MSTGQKIRKLSIKVAELNNELRMLRLGHVRNKQNTPNGYDDSGNPVYYTMSATAQESTNEGKKKNKQSFDVTWGKIMTDMDKHKKENKTTKLDILKQHLKSDNICVYDTDGSYKGNLNYLVEQAIQEITQQKDDKYDELEKWHDEEIKYLHKHYKEIQQQKPQIDDDIMKHIISCINCAETMSNENAKVNIITLKRLLKQLGITE